MQKSIMPVEKSRLFDLDSLKINKYIDTEVMIFIAIGFLLSRSILIGSVAPLGIAFYIYISRINKYRVPVFLSVVAGILLSTNDVSYILKYMACMAIFMIINSKIKEINSITKLSFLGAAILTPISIGQALLSGNYTYDIFIALMEGVIAFIAIYTFSFGTRLLVNLKNREAATNEEIISVVMILIFSIMGIGEISLFGVSLKTVLATSIVLIGMISGGAFIGSASGVVVGLVLMINDITSAVYMGMYSFAGLVGGAFNKINKYLCILGYILSWIIIFSYTSSIDANIMYIRDILIASLIVLLIPKKIMNKIEGMVKMNIGANSNVYDYIDRTKQVTNTRLVNMYKAYEGLADTFDRIRERERVLGQKDIASIIDMVHNEECKTCGMKRRCWDLKFNYTYRTMSELLEILEEYGEISVNDIPEGFRKDCIKPEAIIKVANYYYKLFALDYNWSVKFAESRKLVSNQIRSISKSIEELSIDCKGDILLDLKKENEILSYLERSGVSVDKISYISKGDEYEVTIEKDTCKDCKMCANKIVPIVSSLVDDVVSEQKMGCNSLSGKCKIVLTKAQKYNAVTGVSSMSRDGHILCGDNYTFMEISDGKYMVAISDGMGKGEKAYEESSTTIDILEKMMDAKIDNEIVINTINNILLLKSSDEMFSTLDLGILDLKKGELQTTKMGACPTYIKRKNGDVDLISSSSLPVGILSNVELDKKVEKVKDGDYLIMVSDGIIDAGKNKNLGDNWLIYYLKEIETTNPKEISKLIMNKALDIQEEMEDDMTVLVTKIYNN